MKNQDTHDTLTLDTLKAEYRLLGSNDPWGDAMAFAFPLCEVLYSRDEHDIPEIMGFRPGAGGIELDSEDYLVQVLQDYDTDILEDFGRLLNRLINILKAQGKDY
jgi:hypothetical protein